MLRLYLLVVTALLAVFTKARTDLTGCTSTDVSSPAGASIAWYIPDTGELCEFLDCGGGRAPPKTTVPGCPGYSGTASYSPSYLTGYVQATASSSSAASASASASTSTSFNWDSLISQANTASTSWDLYTTLGNASAPTVLPTSTSNITSTRLASNGTGSGGSGLNNGTFSSAPATASSTAATGGAAETAKAWAGSTGLVFGLGVLVAAL